jgi:hypothetical protein
MAENKPSAINEQVASTTAPPPQKSWFCVGLSPTGEVFRNESDSPETFINLLRSEEHTSELQSP